jgi:hypothetical protein
MAVAAAKGGNVSQTDVMAFVQAGARALVASSQDSCMKTAGDDAAKIAQCNADGRGEMAAASAQAVVDDTDYAAEKLKAARGAVADAMKGCMDSIDGSLSGTDLSTKRNACVATHATAAGQRTKGAEN